MAQNRRKKKGKGKQREDPLQGLLRIDELAEPPTADQFETRKQPETTSSGVGPSTSRNISDPQSENGVVRIDMGQMLQLKDMGYDSFGPVNGPNDGLPEYEVPTAVSEMLSQQQLQHAPNPHGPDVAMGSDLASNVIDPVLVGPDLERIGRQIQNTPHNTVISHDDVHTLMEANRDVSSPIHSLRSLNPFDSSIRPTTPPIQNASSGTNTLGTHTTPPAQLGKRAQVNTSPQMSRRRSKNKKKKVTDNDLAALEAQKMVQYGAKRKSKPNRRR